MSYKQDLKDVAHGTSLVVWAVVICLLAGVVIYFGWMKFGKKTALNLERQAIKGSLQYNEGLRAEINVLITNYNKVVADKSKYEADNDDGRYNKVIDNLTIQIGSIRNQIKDRVGHFPRGELPANVQSILYSDVSVQVQDSKY